MGWGWVGLGVAMSLDEVLNCGQGICLVCWRAGFNP